MHITNTISIEHPTQCTSVISNVRQPLSDEADAFMYTKPVNVEFCKGKFMGQYAYRIFGRRRSRSETLWRTSLYCFDDRKGKHIHMEI